MISTNVYSIHDAKAGIYNNPFVYRTDEEAIRAFAQLGYTAGTPMAAFPADFTLFRLGEYDMETGLLHPLPAPVTLGNLLDVTPPITQEES